jgi:hypothetical protein
MQCSVTRDETRVNHVTTVIKRASLMWKHSSTAPEQKLKATPSVKKIMVTIFWDHSGVLSMDFLEHSATLTVEC